MDITTIIDTKPFHWRVEGETAWGRGGCLFDADNDLLREHIGADGYFITALPTNFADNARAAITRFFAGFNLTPQNYHQQVDDERHQQIISRSRELRMRDLGWDGDTLCRDLSAVVGVALSPIIPDLGRDHVQVRINRPGATDFNPPHRDGALPFYRNTVNLWVPVFGCNDKTRLPVAPGSHLVAESDCLQTAPRGARIGGKTYNVPAIVRTAKGDWNMIRPPVRHGEALIFTPFLVHGVGVNLSAETRVALELRLTVVGQRYPPLPLPDARANTG